VPGTVKTQLYPTDPGKKCYDLQGISWRDVTRPLQVKKV
jgi:hypothetical protein